MSELQQYNPNINTPATAGQQTAGTQALQNLEQQAQAMGNAMKIAEAMCSTSMVPKAYQGKPADGAAAILYGAELGLNAIQSLQQIMVINGKPGIETRTAVALLKNHGYEITTVESSPESVTVEGTGPRGEREVSTWTMQRATTAGYLSNSLYKKIPEQMLYAKAAMEVARKIAPHVLSGIAYSTEELQLEPVRMSATRAGGGQQERGADAVRAALEAKSKPAPEEPVDEPAEVAPTLDEISQAEDMGVLSELMGRVQHLVPDEDYAEYQAAANARHAELQGA